jgi:hypothetical protein
VLDGISAEMIASGRDLGEAEAVPVEALPEPVVVAAPAEPQPAE